MQPVGIKLRLSNKGCVARTVAATFFLAAVALPLSVSPGLAQSHSRDLNGVNLPENVPNFTAVWARDAHNYPKPFQNRDGSVIDGYNNEYVKPWVVELLERDDLVTAAGRSVVTPHSTCYPEGIPYAYGGAQIQILQTPDEIVMLFGDQGQSRTIHMNVPHSDSVEPSWWGESVGHFEGDTLVIDTIGIGAFPQAGSMGRYGTPHSDKLHVVERWRYLREGETSTAPPMRNDSVDADAVMADKVMRLEFTVEDHVAYHKPWSVTIDYQALNQGRVREYVCEENTRSPDLAPLLPRAHTPDF
jgi:hypothetical protein